MPGIRIITKANEENDIIIKNKASSESVLYGVVLDEDLRPIKGAVLKLFMVKENDGERNLYPIACCFTDEEGEFFFGPLYLCKIYFIKIWVNNVLKKHIYFEENEETVYYLDQEEQGLY